MAATERAFPSDPGCVFCKIVAGMIPSQKVYEDELCYAFLDIGPVVVGHTLVVPKGHYVSFVAAPPEVVAALNLRLGKIAQAVMTATQTEACHLLTNAGVEASQSVPHLHYHILPRYDGDGYKLNWPAGKLDATQAARLRLGIEQALARQV